MELALYLSMLGKCVIVAEMAETVSDGGNMLHTQALMLQLRNRGVQIMTSTIATSITEEGVWCEFENKSKLLRCTDAVYAVGQIPRTDEAESLRFAAPRFILIGDARTPKNMATAVETAHYAALRLDAV